MNYLEVSHEVVPIKIFSCLIEASLEEWTRGENLTVKDQGQDQHAHSNSVIYIGKKDAFDSTSPRVKLWSNTKIKIRLPSYKNKDCGWYKHGDGAYRKRKVRVIVGGQESNTKTLRVMKPEECP